jgi:Macrocin-O-methyltransferase (TylF)
MDDKTGSVLLRIARNSHFLQDCFIRLHSVIHPSIEHNVGKIGMLKRALFHVELEGVEGSYFEFGVFEGASLYAAARISRKLKSRMLRKFFGFDSFEGFRYFSNEDKHPFFKEGGFRSSFSLVKKRFRRLPEVQLIKGYFEESLKTDEVRKIARSEKCAVVFVDCDLSSPAFIALDYVTPLLQKGSVIVLDDYWAYNGDEHLGTCGALNRMLKEHPSIRVRPYFTYGHGGMSFIVSCM